MRNLFRRVSFFFWQYPILWLPVAIVDPLVFSINLFAEKLTHAIILSVVTTHSVLSNTPDPITPLSNLQTLRWLLLTKPIDWGSHLLALCLYVCALMTTCSIVSTFRSKQKLSVRKILSPIQRSFRRLVYFSLKLLIVIGIAAIPFILITVFIFQKNGARYISIENFSIIFSTLGTSAIAYLMAPAAVKFLSSQNSETTPAETARQAKISAVLTVITSDALYFIAVQIRNSFFLRSAGWTNLLFPAVTSLISALPYIVLFIALSLLAAEDGQRAETFDDEPGLT
jgi:hypothetical protein